MLLLLSWKSLISEIVYWELGVVVVSGSLVELGRVVDPGLTEYREGC